MEPGVIREFGWNVNAMQDPSRTPHLILEPCDGLGRASSLNRGARMNTPWKLASPPTTVRSPPRTGVDQPLRSTDAPSTSQSRIAPAQVPRTSIWVLHAPCRHRPDDVGSRRPHRGGFASRWDERIKAPVRSLALRSGRTSTEAGVMSCTFQGGHVLQPGALRGQQPTTMH